MTKTQFTFTELRLSLGLFGLLADANVKSTAKVDYFVHKNTTSLRKAWGAYKDAEDKINEEHLEGETFMDKFFYKTTGKDDNDVLYVADGMFFNKTDNGFEPHKGKRYWETEPTDGTQPQKMHYQPVSADLEKYHESLKELQENQLYDFEPYTFAASEMDFMQVDWSKSAEAKELLYDKFIDHER